MKDLPRHYLLLLLALPSSLAGSSPHPWEKSLCVPDDQGSCGHCNGFVRWPQYGGYPSGIAVGCGNDNEWNCDVGYGPNIYSSNETGCNVDGICPVPPQRSCVAENVGNATTCRLSYNWTQSAECCGRWGCGCPQTNACDGAACFENTKACPARAGCPQNGGSFHHDTAGCSHMNFVVGEI